MRTVDPVKHRAKRERIIHAAAGLFATRGLDGTTTAAICEAAGMSAGNVFHYFRSKREIFHAIFLDEEDELGTQLAAALDDADPLEGLLGFVEHLAAPALEPHAPALVLEAMLQASRDEELARLLGGASDDEEDGLAQLVAAAAEAGRIDPGLDPPYVASWINTLIGALFLRAATDESFRPDDELATLRLLVVRFLRADLP